MFANFMNSLPSPVWEEPNETGGAAPEGEPSMLEAGAPAEGEAASKDEDQETAPKGGEGDKASEGKKDEAAAPEPVTFDTLTLPENFDKESTLANDFLEAVNNPELSPADRAQKLIDLQTTVQEETTKQLTEELQTYWDNQRTENRKAVQALPDIGGDKLDESLAQIKKGLEAAGATEETFKAFTETGAGDHPEIIRVLYALTKPHQEGKPVFGSPPQGPMSQADRMFGSK